MIMTDNSAPKVTKRALICAGMLALLALPGFSSGQQVLSGTNRNSASSATETDARTSSSDTERNSATVGANRIAQLVGERTKLKRRVNDAARREETLRYDEKPGQWTYKVVRIDAAQKEIQNLESTLNKLGMGGWELCWISMNGRQAILKREAVVNGKAYNVPAANKPTKPRNAHASAAIPAANKPIEPGNAHASAPNKGIKHGTYYGTQRKSGLIEFESITVNLNDERLNRYLRINLVFQVVPSRQQAIEQLTERKRVVMKNWLIRTLSDITLDETRGKAGQDAIRKKLTTGLNTLLGTEPDAIQDVLFTEFNVQ